MDARGEAGGNAADTSRRNRIERLPRMSTSMATVTMTKVTTASQNIDDANRRLAPGLRSPQLLMQLHLQSNRQLVAKDPVGKPHRVELLVDRRKQHRTDRSEVAFGKLDPRPFVISLVA